MPSGQQPGSEQLVHVRVKGLQFRGLGLRVEDFRVKGYSLGV